MLLLLLGAAGAFGARGAGSVFESLRHFLIRVVFHGQLLLMRRGAGRGGGGVVNITEGHRGGVLISCIAVVSRPYGIVAISPSHPYYAGTEHVGFVSTRKISRAPSAKRCEMFGESHER